MCRPLLLSFLLVVVAACSGTATTALPQVEEFDVVVLQGSDLPYSRAHPVALDDDHVTDAEGVRLYERNGATHYHPVVLAQRGLELLASYELTGDSAYVDLAKRHAERLIEKGVVIDGALYYPYTFDFALHGREDAVLPAPWYSGMAQGQALSLLVRVYQETADESLIEAAEMTFASYQNLKNEGADPWTVMIDDDGYYWLEEYPTPEANHHALNGHIFSIFGLYDYYQETGEGLEELRAAITTVSHYFDRFRNPGGPSYYELKYGVTDEKYHAIHARQFEMLAKISGDDRFADMSQTLICDFPPDPELLEDGVC